MSSCLRSRAAFLPLNLGDSILFMETCILSLINKFWIRISCRQLGSWKLAENRFCNKTMTKNIPPKLPKNGLKERRLSESRSRFWSNRNIGISLKLTAHVPPSTLKVIEFCKEWPKIPKSRCEKLVSGYNSWRNCFKRCLLYLSNFQFWWKKSHFFDK